MEPILILLVIGVIGGVVRSVLGYQNQADPGENFNYVKMAQSALRAAIVGTSVVLGATALTNSPMTTATYIMAFMTAVGSDVLAKEGYGTVKG